MATTFSTDPFSEDKKARRKPRQTFSPESFSRYRFTETGTPVLVTPPKRGFAPRPFTESQTQFNLHCDLTGAHTTIQRSSIVAYFNPPEPTADPLPSGTYPLAGFSDYALCPANGAIFRYRSPARGMWAEAQRKRIQGRKHGGKWSYGPEYFRLLSDNTGTFASLPFDKVLTAAGLTTRQFAQKFKGSQFFVDGVPAI